MNEDREIPGRDGSIRKSHYGEGEQPWDTIVRLGWGSQFAAANIIKYLRRTKDVDHSVESARWYHDRLREMADHEFELGSVRRVGATRVLDLLGSVLTREEREMLR